MSRPLPAPGLPGGRRFAFTIMDDTDVATVENVQPVYRLLADLGFRTTKTVWPVACPEGSRNFASSETLDDPANLAFVLGLARQGFEIAYHGATMETSTRERTERALARFQGLFGSPRVYANHAHNRENLYWGEERLDQPLLRLLYSRSNGRPAGYYQGHRDGTEWYWGDLARAHVTYARNLTFAEVNLDRINPTMPYSDARRPLIPWWFSATDAEDVTAFNALLTDEAVDRLEAEAGICLVATHLGKGFCRGGRVDPRARTILEGLARRNGWFVPAGELLDWLRVHRTAGPLPPAEWRRMQWRWARDLAARQLRIRIGR